MLELLMQAQGNSEDVVNLVVDQHDGTTLAGIVLI